MAEKKNVCLYLDKKIINESKAKVKEDFTTLSSKVNFLLKEYISNSNKLVRGNYEQ